MARSIHHGVPGYPRKGLDPFIMVCLDILEDGQIHSSWCAWISKKMAGSIQYDMPGYTRKWSDAFNMVSLDIP